MDGAIRPLKYLLNIELCNLNLSIEGKLINLDPLNQMFWSRERLQLFVVIFFAGCARTEGYYKISTEEKMLYLGSENSVPVQQLPEDEEPQVSYFFIIIPITSIIMAVTDLPTFRFDRNSSLRREKNLVSRPWSKFLWAALYSKFICGPIPFFFYGFFPIFFSLTVSICGIEDIVNIDSYSINIPSCSRVEWDVFSSWAHRRL